MKPMHIAALACLACLALPAAAQSGDYQQGYREGYDQGFKQGYDRALREGSAQQGNAPPGATMVVPVAPMVPKRGIVVLRAWYGDGERRACNLTAWAAGRFNNRTSQSVNVTNQLCGDPAPGERKQLTVEYMCGAETKRESAYEHRTLSISCY